MDIKVDHASLLNPDEDVIKCLSIEGGTLFDDFVLVPLGGGLMANLTINSNHHLMYMDIKIYDVRTGPICDEKILLFDRNDFPKPGSQERKRFVLVFESNVKLVAQYLELHQEVAKNAGAGNAGHAT